MMKKQRNKAWPPAVQKKLAAVELARRDFAFFCYLFAPDFYRPERTYLKELCCILQSFYEGKESVLLVNLPPRFGKSRTLSLFCAWLLGQNPAYKMISGSYNETLSASFAKMVRNRIGERKLTEEQLIYADIFPQTRLAKGDAAAHFWRLSGQHATFLATSPTGTATGFGCDFLLVDDLIKNAWEANHKQTLQNHWDWFCNTMLSRLEEGGKTIFLMTRWATDDLCGQMLRHCQKQALPYLHFTLPAQKEDGSMLCKEILSAQSWRQKKALLAPEIFAANYQQQPVNRTGSLYEQFLTYDTLPPCQEVRVYADLADSGRDWFCAICFGVCQKEAYVLDIIYTQEPMEKTEALFAAMLHRYGVAWARLEANFAGTAFARNVRRILEEQYGGCFCRVQPFHQSRNKEARLFTHAYWCQQHIYFPVDWQQKYDGFARALWEYRKDGKNEHDDAPDALTGVAEMMTQGQIRGFNRYELGL